MDIGLRVMRSDGYVETTLTTKLTKVIGKIYLPLANALGSQGSGYTAPASSNGSITVPEISGGDPFAYFSAVDQRSRFGILMPSVSFSGNVISWTWNNAAVNYHVRVENVDASDPRIGAVGGINMIYGVYS